MLIIVVTGGVALALTLIRRYCWDNKRLFARHVSSPSISGVQIICGDCCGVQGFPAKTFMDRFGRCQRCGGNSVMLAAHRKGLLREINNETVGVRAHQTLAGEGSTDRAASKDGNGLSQAWGDSTRGAEASVQAVTANQPGLDLLLVANAHESATANLDDLRNELQTWREISVSTDLKQ